MDCIKCTLFINPTFKPIQPAVLVKDSVPNKTVGMKVYRHPVQVNFAIHITLKRGTLKYLNAQSSYC